MTDGDVRNAWWSLSAPAHIDLGLPGIYEWQLEGIGVYIGKSKRLKSRIREYPNNVRKLILGLPYRRGKACAFRAIHHSLRSAHDSIANTTVTVLENCMISELNARERHWITVRKAEAQAGGPPVLNSV